MISKYPVGFIDTTLRMVHDAVDGRPNRELDLRIERIFNLSEVHDDHLDRFPDSALRYTSSLDDCRHLMTTVCPKGKWTLTTGDDGRHGAQVVDDGLKRPTNQFGSPMGLPSLELAILHVLLTKAFILKRDEK